MTSPQAAGLSKIVVRIRDKIMSNELKLREVFARALNVPIEEIIDSLEYNSIEEWDSIAHMALVAAIDTTFDIMLETQDIIDMSSVARAKEILKKYDVEV